MANRDGEYLSLIADGTVDSLYVRGHITHDEAIESIRQQGEDVQYDYEKNLNVVRLFGPAYHIYGRWSMQPTDDGNRHCLELCPGPGRGRFKLTELTIMGTREDASIPGGKPRILESEKK